MTQCDRDDRSRGPQTAPRWNEQAWSGWSPSRFIALPGVSISVIHGLDDFLGHLLGVAEQHHGAVLV
ncbi:hypothetical protein, partial [Mesorhizobium sp. B1-1-4]|uniref:hypothetical protein n=1 Tax=Mesorhizobium sp. B1-1-4 TaxID=2589980 RepID=UPI001AEE0BAD